MGEGVSIEGMPKVQERGASIDADATLKVGDGPDPIPGVVERQGGYVTGPSAVMPLDKLHKLIREGALKALGFADEKAIHPAVLQFLAKNVDAREVFKDGSNLLDVEAVALSTSTDPCDHSGSHRSLGVHRGVLTSGRRASAVMKA